MHDPFKCAHCDKYHKRGHDKKQASHEPEKKEQKLLTSGDEMDWSDGLFNSNVKTIRLPDSGYLNYLENCTDEEKMSSAYNVGFEKGVRKLAEAEAKLSALRTEIANRVPDQSNECVVSYRVWRYDNGNLRSAYMDTLWPQYKPMYQDLKNDMGIHGVKEYKKVIELMAMYGVSPEKRAGNSREPDRIMVAGSINMWGNVREHEIGYLSEYAYPKELFVGDDVDPFTIMTLEDNYGVPVTIREELTKINLPSPYYDQVNFSTVVANVVANVAASSFMYGTAMWSTFPSFPNK